MQSFRLCFLLPLSRFSAKFSVLLPGSRKFGEITQFIKTDQLIIFKNISFLIPHICKAQTSKCRIFSYLAEFFSRFAWETLMRTGNSEFFGRLELLAAKSAFAWQKTTGFTYSSEYSHAGCLLAATMSEVGRRCPGADTESIHNSGRALGIIGNMGHLRQHNKIYMQFIK